MKQRERERKFLVNFANRANCKGVRGNPFHFLFFDTETKQETVKKKIGQKTYTTVINSLDMGWCCYWNRETDKEEWFYFETIEDFNKYMLHVMKISKDKTLWLVAHNIVFDNTIVDIWDTLEGLGFETDFIHAKGMVYLQKYKKTKIVKVKDRKTGEMKDQKKTLKSLMLVNNGNIFPTTLKNIGETVGLKKMDVDFEHSSREYVKEYCKRDVEILIKFWREWCIFIAKYDLGNVKYTISSQSMEAFKHKFCEEYIMLDDDIENLSFERLAYYGGRTEIFHKGQIKKKIYYYDVNSMYPHVMKEFRYPTDFKFYKENVSLEQMEYYLKETDYLVIAECNIVTKNNCYPVKQSHTLLFPIGSFTTYLATPEVIEGMKNGDIKSFGRVSFYKSANVFSSYIDFFYNERLRLKHEGNKQEKMIKLFLNSLYGKFGQMMDEWEPVTEEEIKIIDPNFDLGKWIMDEYKLTKFIAAGVDITPHIRYIGGQLQIATDKKESHISFPAIAAHVTSYARLIIWDVIKYCQEHKIKYYYCDTDSIFVEKELPEMFVDENILGKMKVEKIFENGCEFINLKNYCELDEHGNKFVALEGAAGEEDTIITMDDEVFTRESKVIKGSAWKMKGVPNKAQMISEDEFITQEWGGLPKQEYYKKFGRKPGEFWVIYKTKKNHGTINKGHLQKNGDIKPFEL